jgi:3-oxoacyl-[acyl-carrier protein] reductase
MKRVAIVTGGGQGIGRGYARRLASDGFRIVVADRNEEKAQAVATEIAGEGAEAAAVAIDVADETQCERMSAAALERFGRIDVLINNAAIFSTIELKPFWELSVNEWDELMAVNVRGSWLAMKAVVPAMRDQGGGSIVNVSSSVVLGGRPNYLHYVTSKSAVIGMTRAAARELGAFNIRVNCIMPGATTTEIPRKTVSPERAQALLANQSLKRAAGVDDLIGVAAFLASDDSRFMTGQTLNVDGGNLFL